MVMGYFSSDQENQINAAMRALHDEFANRNTFYALKDGETTIITQNSDHNYFYPNAKNNTTTTTTTTTGIFNARLYFPNIQSNKDNDPLDNQRNNQLLNINVQEGIIKIVTDITGKNFLFDAKRVRYDDTLYKVENTHYNKHGLLSKQFYTYFLKPLE